MHSPNWGVIKTEATNVSQKINLDGVPQPSYGLAFTNEPTKRDITIAQKKDFEWEEKDSRCTTRCYFCYVRKNISYVL